MRKLLHARAYGRQEVVSIMMRVKQSIVQFNITYSVFVRKILHVRAKKCFRNIAEPNYLFSRSFSFDVYDSYPSSQENIYVIYNSVP